MTRKPRLLCAGIVTWDWLFRIDEYPAHPVKVIAREHVETGGGMSASAACAIARLGGEVEFWGRCGDDSIGDLILADMRGYGVRVDRVRRIAGRASPVAAILIDGAGERLVVPYYDAALDPDHGWLPLGDVAGFDGVMVDLRWPPGAGAVLDAARCAGRIAMLDGDTAPREILDDLVPRATHVVFSEPGLVGWTGVVGAEAGLRAARRRHPGFLAVTLGPDGVMWLEGDVIRSAPAPAIDAVDTLAAGDVFHGAMLLALAEARPIEEAARFACIAAAFKCRRFGSRTATPTRAEVEAALAAAHPRSA